MSNQCDICHANHEKLGVYSCNYHKCRGELFYHISFKNGKSVMYDTRYDGSWDWGIVLDPMLAQSINPDYYLQILSTNGECIVEWSRHYDYNFKKLFSAYSRLSYYKNENGKKVYDTLYTLNLTKKLPLICGLNYYLINKDRDDKYSLSYKYSESSPQGGVGMYALVMIQYFWLDLLKAKRQNKKRYRYFIYEIFKNSYCKNKSCLKHMVEYI